MVHQRFIGIERGIWTGCCKSLHYHEEGNGDGKQPATPTGPAVPPAAAGSPSERLQVPPPDEEGVAAPAAKRQRKASAKASSSHVGLDGVEEGEEEEEEEEESWVPTLDILSSMGEELIADPSHTPMSYLRIYENFAPRG